MISLLILICLSAVKCENWCPFVKPNNNYKGLGIYRRFYRQTSNEYVMFNRAGAEWLFRITYDEQNKAFGLQFNNSVKRIQDDQVLYRFGSTEPQKLNRSTADCVVKSIPNTTVSTLIDNKINLVCIQF